MHTGLKKKRGPGIKVTHTFTEMQQWAGTSGGETLCRMQFSPPFPSRKIPKPQNSWYWELLLEGREEGPTVCPRSWFFCKFWTWAWKKNHEILC